MSLLVVILAWFLVPGNVPATQDNMIRNGDFSVDTDGNGTADDWQFAGDNGVSAACSRDRGFQGPFSQKLSCTRFDSLSPASHAMLCQVDTLRLEKGKWYRISFAAKQEGIPGRVVQVAISDTASWQNCGLQESFRILAEWRQFQFSFQATETLTDHVRLQFWFTSTGSLWLDNVQLEPSGPVSKRFTEILPESRAVNLLPNSSFECGISGWGSIAELPGWGGNLNLPVGQIDTSQAKFHRSSFRITLSPETLPVFYFDYFPLYRVPVKAPLLANRGWISVETGKPYTLSAYMKAGSEELMAVLSCQQAFRGPQNKSVRLKKEWDRYVFTFNPQTSQVFIALGLDLEASKRDSGVVWIDGVQLEKGSEATAYVPRNPVEIGLETERPGNLFPQGIHTEMTARVFSDEPTPRSLALQVRITDFDDRIVQEMSIPIQTEPGRTVGVPVTPSVEQMGFYRAHLQCDAAEVVLTRPLRFAKIDPYSHSDSLFGMNHAYPWPELLDLSKQIGLCWFRDWSLKWHDVEPEKGRFDFTGADAQIDRVLARDLRVLPLLPFPSSNWSSSAGPDTSATDSDAAILERIACMPRNLENFSAYVSHTVQHYQGRLKVWEILNEPIYTSYALPRTKGYQVKDYVRLLEMAYKAVKTADPSARVIGGIAGGPDTCTREFVEAGGLEWVDALNLHVYPGQTLPGAYEEPLRQLRERMRAAKKDKPIWFTEGAYYADDDKPFEPFSEWLSPADSEIEAAENQVKLNTLLLAYGTEKIIYHSGTPGSLNNESLSGIFFEWAGEPRKMLTVQVAMANLLVPPIKSLDQLRRPSNVQAYGFQTQSHIVIIAWVEDGSLPINITRDSSPWQLFDLQGNELPPQTIRLTERPVYFVKQGTTLQELPW
jgi:hypothetical protein